MATTTKKIQAELRVRELLEAGDLPQPDRVEYGFTCIRLFFDRPKVALVIDLDELGDDVAAIDADSA